MIKEQVLTNSGLLKTTHTINDEKHIIYTDSKGDIHNDKDFAVIYFRKSGDQEKYCYFKGKLHSYNIKLQGHSIYNKEGLCTLSKTFIMDRQLHGDELENWIKTKNRENILNNLNYD